MAQQQDAQTEKRRRWTRPVLLIALAVGLVAGLKWAHWRYIQHRFRIIAPGEVYQSAQMPMDDLLDTVRERGIKTVLDLREEGQGELELERETLEEAGIRYVNLPTPQVPTLDTVGKYLDLIQEEDALPMLIHCEHGEGRSVLFSALYRIEVEGWQNEEARKATRMMSWRGSFAPGSRKGEFLRGYEPTLELAGAGEAAMPAASR